MTYGQKIERQRMRFYASARSVMRKSLRKYTDELMTDINKAHTTQQILLVANKPLRSTYVQQGIKQIYINTLPFFANQTSRQLMPKKSTPDPITTDQWDAYIASKVVPKLAKRISWITGTTEQVFKETAQRLCAQGLKEGLGIDKIASMIQSELNISEKYRAERIARTEVVSASNEGSFAGAKDTGLDMDKEWIAYMDDKTRQTHADMNGTTVGMDETFNMPDNFGSMDELQYPGDNGSPENTINCRCTIGYVMKDGEIEIGRAIE